MIKSHSTANLRAFDLKLNEIGETNIISIVVRANNYVVFYKDPEKKARSRSKK